MLFFSLLSILDLLDIPLIRILQFISLDKILKSVNRTWKRLYTLIKYTAILWTGSEWLRPLCFRETDLEYIFIHSRYFRSFEVGYVHYANTVASLDYHFVTGLSLDDVTDLNLSNSHVISEQVDYWLTFSEQYFIYVQDENKI